MDRMRNFILSFSLPHLPNKIYHSLSFTFVPISPIFSSILYPSPSTQAKHYLFSNIHLSFLILLYLLSILVYLFLSLSITFQTSLSLFTFLFLPSILYLLQFILKFYTLSFADHIFGLCDDIILCLIPPSLLNLLNFSLFQRESTGHQDQELQLASPSIKYLFLVRLADQGLVVPWLPTFEKINTDF